MEGKIEINRLERDELQYELTCRGITDRDTVREMRTCLRSILKIESSSTKLTYPTYGIPFVQDVRAVQGKIAELKELIDGFADVTTSPMFLKITTKLIHTFNRAKRAVASNDEESSQISRTLVELVKLQIDLKSRARKFKKNITSDATPLELSVLMSSTNIEPDENSEISESDEDVEASVLPNVSTPVHLAAGTHNAIIPNFKSIPVSKWNIRKFDGDVTRLSLSAFFENVEELCLSRNVTKQQLMNSASDLFTGRALIYYRSIKSRVADWSDLVRELRLQFQPVNFNDKLFQEIKNRTQGSEEPMGLYLATMSNMFARLTVPVNEAAKLKLILQNLTPFYQGHLGLMQVNSLEQLLELGRKLEVRKETMDAYAPPPRNRRSLIEPDLACVYSSQSSLASSHKDVAEISTPISKTCWNCGKVGHLSSRCDSPRTRHCFSCGRRDVIRTSCPNCNKKNSGNEARRRQ